MRPTAPERRELASVNNYLVRSSRGSYATQLGAGMTMQDRTDLAAIPKRERFYAKVKHFNRKTQGDLNDHDPPPAAILNL